MLLMLTEKKKCSLNENCVLFHEFYEDFKPGSQPLRLLWGTSQRGKAREEPGYKGVSSQKAGGKNIKKLLLIKENQTPRVNEFSAFYVWEDARV